MFYSQTVRTSSRMASLHVCDSGKLIFHMFPVHKLPRTRLAGARTEKLHDLWINL